MNCEMCGAQTNLEKYRVEGVLMSLCPKCGAHGIKEKEPKKALFKYNTKKEEETKTIELVKEEYAQIIRNAREKTGLKQKDLAQKIAEKESLIHNIESGHHKPSIKLARKLERFLHIELITKYEEKKLEKQNLNEKAAKGERLTIGDMIKKKMS